MATQADNVNIAKNKPCSASTTGTGGVGCENIVDGVEQARNDIIYHSGRPTSDWLQIDLGAEYLITKVVVYNRVAFAERLNGAYLQLLNANGVITGQRTLNGDLAQTFAFSTSATSVPSFTPVCETNFQGGGWLLVRRAQGSAWSPSTDHLLGLDVFGVYGTSTSASTFSIAFNSFVTSSTEFLFTTGLHLLLFSFSFFIFRFPILVLSFKVIWMCYGLKFRSFPISP